MPDLSPHQFTAFRGLLVGTGRAPEDDEELLSRINPKGPDNTVYGRHWSRNHEVARNFATNPNAGGYETLPARMRKFTGDVDKWGVVLEGTARGRAREAGIPYSEHEREVSVHHPDFEHQAANHLESVTAHVYDMPSRDTIAEQYPRVPGQRGVGVRRVDAFKQGLRVPVRSLEIPESHWRR